MTFRRDLETWTADQVALRGLSGLSSDIRRLLRGADVGGLSPVDSSGLPSEILEAFPPSRDVPTEPPPESSTWICWPSADNAPYGWGDPYGPNPPLGTIQPSFSDTAHIAREIDASDIVTHGVNKIAGPRDWRHDSSPLVVSWDSESIYSGGVEVVSGQWILAACVRWVSGTPHLLWLVNYSDIVYAVQCTIEDDVVTGVVGDVTSLSITGGMNDVWWCEFSQDGSLLALNLGDDVTTNESYYAVMPWPFTGQAANPVFAEKAEDPVINWVSNYEYSGTQRFLLKSQFISNTLTHAWLDVSYSYFYNILSYDDAPIFGLPNCNNFGCFWKFLDAPVWYATWNDQRPSWAQDNYENLDIDMAISFSTTQIITDSVSHINRHWWSWYINAAEGEGDPGSYPDYPSSQYGPFPGWEYPLVYITDEQWAKYRCVARQAVDMRSGSLVLLDVGDGLPRDYFPTNTWMQIEVHGSDRSNISPKIDGDFGYFKWPFTMSNQATLVTELLNMAKQYCPSDNRNISTLNSIIGVSSVSLSSARVVSCAWGMDENDSIEYYVDFLEGADIDTMLSIESQDNQRIIIRSADRFFGLLKQS